MLEKIYSTRCGQIHYWINPDGTNQDKQLVFLPGLTADHRLFDKQIEYFEGKYPMFVWDAPAHALSYPFDMDFSLADKATWLNEILLENGFDKPVIIGQSMGGYLGQMFMQLFPNKVVGFVSIDSAPLQKQYYTGIELWLLHRMTPVYRHYPWKTLLRQGTNGVATSEYGRALMKEFMMTYDGDQDRYSRLAGGGYRILVEAVEAELPYEITCPVMLICGTKDMAGSTKRYNRAWHAKTGLPLHWIEGAGHNANTDKPEEINRLITEFLGEATI